MEKKIERIEAWEDMDMIILVIELEDGSYYEHSWDIDSLSNHFSYVPEGC
mgnify:CR=1 FL=1